MQHALVMIVHRHGKRLLGAVLSDHVFIKSCPNLCRLWDPNIRRLTPGVFVELFIENAFADVDAAVANLNAGAGDELAYLGMALAAKRAHREIGSAGHKIPSKKAASIPRLCGVRRPPPPLLRGPLPAR